MRSIPRGSSRVVATATVVVLVAASVAVASPAFADAPLTAAFSAGDGSTYALSGDASADVLELVADGTLTLDLAGYDLTVQSIVLGAGSSLRITDSTDVPGTLTADSRSTVAALQNEQCDGSLTPLVQSDAAIQTTDATLTIDGSAQVVALSGHASAAIGSSTTTFASPGVIHIAGSSSVTASALSYASGIGGGCYGSAGSITVADHATVNATGGRFGAGIGAMYGTSSDEILITDFADVTAACSSFGCAAIGSGLGSALGDVTISGESTVDATGSGGTAIGAVDPYSAGVILITDSATVVARQGSYRGTGIGNRGPSTVHITGHADVTAFGGGEYPAISGGSGLKTSAVTIDGFATVDATAGEYGPALGGNRSASKFGMLSIGQNATVTARSSTSGAAVGGQSNGVGAPLGTLDIDGSLILPTGSWMEVPVGFTVNGDGSISGGGRIDNHGVIALPDAGVTAAVSGNNFRVSYAVPSGTATPPSERVLAPTFAALDRALPTVVRPPNHAQRGWVNGSKAFTAASVLTKSVTLAATWVPYADSLAPPTVTGTRTVGNTLSAATAGWPADTVETYQWLRNGKPIAGATSASYTLVGADHTARVQVKVTGMRAGYRTVARVSAPGAKVAAGVFVSGGASITGMNVLGATLGIEHEGWMPRPAFSYQWIVNGQPVSRATNPTYTVTTAGAYVSVIVTARSRGYTSAQLLPGVASSDGLAQFVASPTPTTSGTPKTGNTLTASTGSWSPSAKLTYQWLRNGVAIVGATARTYKLPNSSMGTQISVAVTGARSGLVSKRVESAKTPAVLGTISGVPKTIHTSGYSKVGHYKSATTYGWPANVTLTYEWLRRTGSVTEIIAGENDPNYLVVPADKGSYITVRITASRPGYASAQRASNWTSTSRVVG